MVGNYTEGDEPIPGFRLSQLLGWGRFGEVWKASGPGGITVAVKIIPLSSRQGLKEFRAIRLVKQIRHPNLVPIMAFWLKDRHGNFIDDSLADDTESLHELASELIIVMGLGEKSLHDRLMECCRAGYSGIPLEELLVYMLDIGRAIDYLNRRAHLVDSASVGIQHCDIKPHNVLLVGGVAQLCDLGVARVLEDTRASAATGSAAYIAPEFIRTGKPSSATDQYSLGVTYVELRTGLLPFLARSAAAAYLVHLNGELDLSGLSTPEREVLARATAMEAKDRFPSCAAFVKALEEACGRIPPEEAAVIDGVARLNASGLIAGEKAAGHAAGYFGPFYTATVEEACEDLALSDGEDGLSEFMRKEGVGQRDHGDDETATAVCRLRPPAFEPGDHPAEESFDDAQEHAASEFAPSPSAWDKLTESYHANMAKLKTLRGASWHPAPGSIDWRSRWQALSPRSRKFIRYGGQLALLALLGIAAGQATSSFNAAERSTPDRETTASIPPRTSLARSRDTAPDSRYEAILKLRNDGNFALALEKLNQVIEGQPNDSLAYLYRAELETDCGMLTQALADADRVVKEHSADPVVHACRARILLARGDFVDALNECDRVLNYDLQNPNVLYMRSLALNGLKQYRPGLSAYRSAHKLLPRTQPFQPSTGLALGKNGLTVDAGKGTDLKPRVKIWRDAKDASPRTLDGGTAIALAPDGHTLAIGADKNIVNLIDLEDKQPASSFTGHDGPITALAFCREGRWLASASEDRTIKVWNVEDGKLIYNLDGHSKPIKSLAYCPVNDLLASGSGDQTIRIWNLKRGTCQHTVTGHQGEVLALAFAPLGRLLVSGSADKLIKFWDSATGSEIGTLSGHSSEVTSLAFSKDGRMLASGSADLTWPLWPGQIKLWQTVSGSLITTLGGHPNGVYQLAFDPDGDRLVSAGPDFQLRYWEPGTYAQGVTAAKK